MKRRMLFLVTVAALGATATYAKPKYDPFKIPREQFVERVKTVALREMSGVDKDYAHGDSVRATFEALLTAELEQAGFKVVPAKVYEQLRQESLDSLGGLFDPKTGAPDTAKATQARRWTLEQLEVRHQADALLHSSLATMTASFSSGTAHWDGTKQKLWKGAQGFLGLIDNKSGRIPALSLVVIIEDTQGNDLYLDSGGLCLKARIKGVDFEDLPGDSLYGNPRRNSDAVRLALQALTRPAVK